MSSDQRFGKGHQGGGDSPEDEILESTRQMHSIERNLLASYGRQVSALSSRVRQLETHVDDTSDLRRAVGDVQRETRREIRVTREALANQLQRLAESLAEDEANTVTSAELEGVMARERRRLDAYVVELVGRQDAASLAEEQRRRLAQMEARFEELEGAYQRKLQDRHAAFEARIAALEERVATTLGNERRNVEVRLELLDSRMAELEAAHGRWIQRLDEEIEARFQASIERFHGEFRRVLVELEGELERVRGASVGAPDELAALVADRSSRKWTAQLAALETALRVEMAGLRDTTQHQVGDLEQAYRLYLRDYAQWVRGQLQSLRSSVTDREVVSRLLVEVASRFEDEHVAHTHIVEPLEEPPGWAWARRDPANEDTELAAPAEHADAPSAEGDAVPSRPKIRPPEPPVFTASAQWDDEDELFVEVDA